MCFHRGVTSDVSTEAQPPGLLYVVKQLELLVRSRLDEVLRPAGVTTLQYTALTVLAQRPGTTSADLARLSFTTAQSTADLVSGLLKKGLVERAPDPTHRRRLLLDLTDAGRELLVAYGPVVDALEEEMCADLTEWERGALRDLLTRARRSLTPRA